MDWPSVYRIAALSGADPKTVKRVADGKPTRPTVRTRIMAAMLECGMVPLAASPNEPSGAPSAEPAKA
jgi:DNA-binding LacI/PurR family transcriptional regulator